MATKKFILDKYAAGMFKRQDQYAAKVKGLYDKAIDRMIMLAQQMPEDLSGKPFSFSDNPRIANETAMVIRQLYSAVYSQIKEGVEAEWNLANLSCDKIIGSVFGWTLKDRNLCARWFERNREAMDAFFVRKSQEGGLNLSQRVWKYTGSLRQEMETAIQVSIGEGVPASTMARRVRKYLREPDRLYRRVRGADGNLHLSAAAKNYHPGQGVYRSSYRNAMRLARTETNAAYRAADEDRWERMDFVVGYEVKLSNNHTTLLPNGKIVPLQDICDDLKGKYPKTFKFTAWHPHCRCYVVPILATPDEMAKMQQAILEGKNPASVPVQGRVNDVPEGFKEWVSNNSERILSAKSQPYFIRDNQKIFKKGSDGLRVEFASREQGIIQAREKRLATRDSADIQARWNQRKYDQAMALIKKNDIVVGDAMSARLDALQDAIKKGDTKAITSASDKVMRGIDIQTKWDKLVWKGISPEQKTEMRKLEQLMGIRKGRPMTHEQADTGLTNPKYTKKWIMKGGKWELNPNYDKQYSINCQTCVPAYMLRRWGFNIEALGNIERDPVRNVWKILKGGYTDVWINKKGGVGYGRAFRTFEPRGKLFSQMEKCDDGIYQVECTWKGSKSGHTFVFVKEKGKNFMYDPQTNKVFRTAEEFKEYSRDMSTKWQPSYFRIDDLRPNSDALQHIIKKSEATRDRHAEILEIARKRHEARDVDALNKRIEERRKRHELIQKQAQNVMKVAKGYTEVDTAKMYELLNDYKLPQLQQETRRIAKEIAAVNKKVSSFEDVIPNAKTWLDRYSSSEIESAYNAVKRTFARWTWDFDTDTSLSFLKGRLEREIGVVRNSKYVTREIAESAYQARLDYVKRRIETKSIRDSLDSEFAFVKTSRKQVLRDMSAEINSLLKDDKADLSEIRKKADAFRDAVAKSMARRQARLMKSAKGASSSGVSPVSGNPMTDSEIVDEMQKLFRSHGYSLDVDDISIKDGCVHLTGMQHNVLAKICNLTDAEMKQTWRHYEGGYIQTGNSFKINGALRDIEGKGANALRGPISASDPRVALAKDLFGRTIGADDILTVNALDRVIGKNSLPFPVTVVRNVDIDGILPFFRGLSATAKTPKAVHDEILKLADKSMIPDCGFMSVSTNADMNVFKNRRFQLQIEVPQNTPIYVTKNFMESECVLARETQLIFKSVEYDKTNKICIIKCIAT